MALFQEHFPYKGGLWNRHGPEPFADSCAKRSARIRKGASVPVSFFPTSGWKMTPVVWGGPSGKTRIQVPGGGDSAWGPQAAPEVVSAWEVQLRHKFLEPQSCGNCDWRSRPHRAGSELLESWAQRLERRTCRRCYPLHGDSL